MPQPTYTDVHVSVPLTNISTAYRQDRTTLIADKIAPNVPVTKQSNKYYTYTKNDWFRDEAKIRMGAGQSAGSGYTLSTDNYSCDIFAFHKDIDYPTRSNADAQIDLDRDATEFVTDRLLIRKERQVVTDYFATSIWGLDITGVSGVPSTNQVYQWSDYTNSDPIDDIDGGKEQILSTTGRMANKLVIGWQVFRKLKNHPIIIDRLKYTMGVTGKTVTPALLAAMFDIDEVLVASSIYASNKEGETAAYAFNIGKVALLLHVAPNPGLLVPSAAYTFSWSSGVNGGVAGADIGIKTIPMPWENADRIEGESAFDNKLVAADLGVYFPSIIA